jgi:hypothetical protein
LSLDKAQKYSASTYNDSMSTTVVAAGDCSESLLSSCVPLQSPLPNILSSHLLWLIGFSNPPYLRRMCASTPVILKCMHCLEEIKAVHVMYQTGHQEYGAEKICEIAEMTP